MATLDEHKVLTESFKQPLRVYFWEIFRRAWVMKRWILLFLGIFVTVSFVQMVGLFCFQSGFSIAGAEEGSPGRSMSMVTGIFASLGFAPGSWWLIFFSFFLLMSVLAITLEHLGWKTRLIMLHLYESTQMLKGLKSVRLLDPREFSNLPRKQLFMAVRSDCRAMGMVVVLSLAMAISLVQTFFPFCYIFTLDVGMSMVGIGVLFASLIPIFWLGTISRRLSLEVQSLALDVGSRVSRELRFRGKPSPGLQGDPESLGDIGQAMARQQALLRKQILLRSLAAKIPQGLAFAGTFAVIVWGAAKISSKHLSWAELLTFIVALRVVLAPLGTLGQRWIKVNENLGKAIRHLNLLNLVQTSSLPGADKSDLLTDGGRPRVEALVIRDLSFPPAQPQETPPLNLELRPGTVLAILDSGPSQKNPLFPLLAGDRYVEHGQILLNGQDLNCLQYESLLGVYGLVRSLPPAFNGEILKQFQEITPLASQAEMEYFASAVIGPEEWATFPDGLRTPIHRNNGAYPPYAPLCFWLLELWRLQGEGKSVLLLQDELAGEEVRKMLHRYWRHYGASLITIYLGRTLPAFLEPNLVAVFTQGRYQGCGDAAWFREHFADWTAAAGSLTGLGLSDWEALAEEMAQEALEDLEEEEG
jgi:ABC-type multidrug transport system fused ATPase/permease subunit